MSTTLADTKKKTVRINGCVASAQAAKYADVDVITAYPIRPYTATMMALAQMVANGELDAEYIVADSEHSQLSIAHGASSSGARVFTGSSGVGVQFAYELYSPISGSRMPVQMMIADRTLEHLVPSDRMIVETLRRLYEAAWALKEHGTAPSLVDDPEASAAVRSGEVIAPASEDWLAVYDREIAAARHPSLPRAAE